MSIEKIKEAAQIKAAREQFLPYVTYIEPKYETPIHVRVLASYLEAVERGDIRRLIITEPPRHGKSYITSGMFPGWCIGRDPSRVVMLISHSADLAETFSIQNREIIHSNPSWPKVFPDVVLNPNKRGASMWAVNRQRENMIANGVMGGLTGYGAWMIIFDDPVKTFEQAQSPTTREKIYNEYKSSARTRLTPDGRMIIIMTRWHEEDLVGKIEKSPDWDNWTVLHLPALSYGTEEDYIAKYPDEATRTKVMAALPKTAFPDPLKRPLGEPLWPERWTKDFLEEQKLLLQHQFEALYQGNPSAPEGNKFKREWFRPLPTYLKHKMQLTPLARARSYDLSFGGTVNSDYTAGVKATLYKVPPWSQIEDEEASNYVKEEGVPSVILLVEHVYHSRRDWDETSEQIIMTALQDGARYDMYFEGVAAQNIGWKSLRKDERLWKHTIQRLDARGTKNDRASYAVKLASAGMVFLEYPTPAQGPSWEEGFINELASFPAAKHDDQFDALVQLVNRWQPQIDQHISSDFTQPQFRAEEKKLALHELPMFQDSRPRKTWARDQMGWFK